MKKSKYSLVIDETYLFNTLWGSLEKINKDFLKKWNEFKWDNFSDTEKSILKSRKHVVDDSEEILNYEDFNVQSNNVSRFYIIFSYDCNLNCTYCFENNIKKKESITNYKLDYLFASIKKIIKIRKSEYNEIVLFGGEPFLLKNYSMIDKTLNFCKKNNIFVSAISNGTNISIYSKIIKEYKSIIKWMSITIDGTKEYNDIRRVGKNKEGTFSKIIENIDCLIQENIKVSIRMNIDKNNVNNVPDFINYMRCRYDNKIEISLSLVEDNTNIGNKNLLSYNEITNKLIDFNLLSVDNVEINIKPINKINNILNNPKISMPLFKYCWIGSYYTFTPSGEIFVCPESCEHHSLKIGNFYPNSYINEQKIKFLLELNALNIDMCKNCYFAPICGSGCYIRRIANQNICYKKDIYQSLQTQINNIEKRKKS